MPDVTIDDKELAALRKSAAQAGALEAKLSEQAKELEKLPALQAQLQEIQARATETAFSSAGISDPKIRKLFSLEFDEQSTTEGGQKDLGAWLQGLKADASKAPAILAPFLGAAQAAQASQTSTQTSTQTTPAQTGNAGVTTGSVTTPVYTPESISKMTTEEFKAALPNLVKLYPQAAAMASAIKT